MKSAAGEGPEPQVPGRDQPAQELANLIAQSEAGAKGKGFWRRRRRKNTTPEPPTGASQEATEAAPAESKVAAPATVESAEAADESTGTPDAATDESVAAAEASTGESAESGTAMPGETAESAESTEAAPGKSAEAAEDESSASGDAEAASGADAKADAAGAETSAEPADAAAEDDADLAPGDSSAKAAEVSSTEGAETGDSKDGSSAEDAAESVDDVESAGSADAAVAAEAGEGVAEKVERPRPTVGVVYEPDESPDGFPLEYGNIIVGLPKQADGSSVEIDEARAYAEELAAVESAGLESAQTEDELEEPTEQAAAEEPGEEVAETASEESAEDTEPEVEQPSDEAESPEAEQAADEAETPDVPVDAVDEAETPDVPVDAVDEESVESDSDDESADDVVEPAAEEPAAEESAEATAVAEEAVEGDSGDEVAETAADEPAEDVADDVQVEQASAEEADEDDESAEPVEVELTAEELAERLAAEQAAMVLITSLMKLRGALAGSRLPLDVVGADEARQQQKAMLDQLDDYILPRLVQLEAPILAVVGGSTGAGKSTLVNSVIGKVVSEPGVLRPTTRSPVLIHHPADADWFIGDRVLPGMARTTAESPGGMEDPGQLRLVASDTVPRGLAVLDAPDIDSVVEANRDLATQLLAAADLWLFVTTAARYSDAVPWEFLQSASDRSTAVAVVLDRAPAETIDDITGHLAQMLLERGLGDSPLFSIRETVVDGNGMLPDEAVASIKDWLVDLAADAESRAAVVRRTLHGAVTGMVKTTPPFAAAVRAQGDTAAELRSSVEAAYDQAVKDIATSTQDATLLRGEVLARWQEFVGTGELLKGLQGNSGKLREKVKKSIATAPAPTRDLNDAIESGLSSLLIEQAEVAAERAEKIWQATPAGRQLLAVARSTTDPDAEPSTDPEADTSADDEIALGAMSPEFRAKAERAVREWQAGVLDLVREVGTEKRLAARILDAGVNGLSLSVMVVLFAENAGIPTGAEASIGVGSAVVGQKLLTAVFGDAAVQTLMSKARADLDGKVHALMDAEFARYLAVLDQHPVDPEAARQLTEAARAVEDCT
ncbi:AAA family ATPase [Kribbella albertanoniae]|nr:AAA family ATPase [Kribbella albertanoniae]